MRINWPIPTPIDWPTPTPLSERADSLRAASRTCLTQRRSPLFARLPAELRQHVFGLALGGKVHVLVRRLVTDKRRCYDPVSRTQRLPRRWTRVGHVACYQPREDDWWRHACLVERWDVAAPGPDAARAAEGAAALVGCSKEGGEWDARLALVRTCRRAYAETQALLYAAPLFDLCSGADLRTFALSILPQHLENIRSLELRHFHSKGGAIVVYNGVVRRDVESRRAWNTWDDIVDVLRHMTGLRTLKLEISSEKGGAEAKVGPRIDEGRLLEPLKELEWIGEVVVEVNWLGGDGEAGEEVEEGKGRRFVLKRLIHR